MTPRMWLGVALVAVALTPVAVAAWITGELIAVYRRSNP